LTTATNNEWESLQVAEVSAQAMVLAAEAESVAVVSDSNVSAASELLARCNAHLKDSEELRKRLTKPLLDHKKLIDSLFKEKLAPVVDMEAKLRRAIAAYHTEKEHERRRREIEAREALREAAKRREAENERLAQAIGVDPATLAGPDPDTFAVVVPENVRRVDTAAGSVSARPVTRVAIEDANLVPRAYCTPDEKAIHRYVDFAVKQFGWDRALEIFAADLPGVRVWREMTTVVGRPRTDER
jgi:hypothetical protein